MAGKVRLYKIESFHYNHSVRTIHLPPTLKTIGEFAFAESSIEDVVLPWGLEKIGARAFFATTSRSPRSRVRSGSSVKAFSTAARIS